MKDLRYFCGILEGILEVLTIKNTVKKIGKSSKDNFSFSHTLIIETQKAKCKKIFL